MDELGAAQGAVPRAAVPYWGLVHYALRWTVGLLLVATSLGKALDVPGFRDVLAAYDIFPGWSLWLIAFAMPVIEALIALSLLTGRRLREGIGASLLLHGSFAVMLTIELLRGVHLENCGCFGVFLARPLTWSTPLEDVAIVLLTLGIAVTRSAAPAAQVSRISSR